MGLVAAEVGSTGLTLVVTTGLTSGVVTTGLTSGVDVGAVGLLAAGKFDFLFDEASLIWSGVTLVAGWVGCTGKAGLVDGGVTAGVGMAG